MFFALVAALVLFNVFMYWMAEVLRGRVFDGCGFELHKVILFVLWVPFFLYVEIFNMIFAISAISAAKQVGRNWRK